MKKSFLFLSLIIATCWGCSQREALPERELTLKVTELATIGTYDTSNKASLYSVAGVQAGPHGQIYVADDAELKIKVYGRNEELIYTFGKRGRGPGEFISIKGFSLINEEVFVWDRSLQRLSVFELDGKLKTIHTLKGIMTPLKMYALGDSSYLAIYPQYGPGSIEAPENIVMAHIYDHDFAGTQNSFLSIDEVDDKIEEIRNIILTRLGSVHVSDQRKFYFVPFVYDGNIYEYSQVGTGNWEQSSIHPGQVRIDPYTLIEEGYNRRFPDITYNSGSLGVSLRMILHNQSRGLVRKGNHFYHFIQSDVGNKRIFGVEVYNEQMKSIGYAPIRSIPITNERHNYLVWFVEGIDSNGNFYLMERYPDGSQIRILDIDVFDLQQ